MATSNIVTIKMPQGTDKCVDLSEVENWRGGVKLENIVRRAFLNGWNDQSRYYVNNRAADKYTLLYGGETVTVTKRHDNGQL